MQHALCRAAKADPGRRFHASHDKVLRRDVMWRAWVQVRRNGGAADIDQITLEAVEKYGVARLLDELVADLKDGRWRPVPARRVFIPKQTEQTSPFGVAQEPEDAAAREAVDAMLNAGMLDGLLDKVDTGELRLTGGGGFCRRW